MENFWEIFWSILGILGTGLATWLVTVFTTWMNSKIKDKKVANRLTSLTTIITNAVKTVYQEFVEIMKNNGTFDEKAQKEAKEKTMAIIHSQLTPELQSFIQSNYGDIEEWLKNQIEAVLYNLKNKQTKE